MTFDLDANGILNVTAAEFATGKKSNITIQNDKGRLTKEQIDAMVAAAETYREQDEQMKAAVHAKNELESYVYSLKTMVSGNIEYERR